MIKTNLLECLSDSRQSPRWITCDAATDSRLIWIKLNWCRLLVAHVPDGNSAFVDEPICSFAAALVTFKAQSLLSHAPYFFIELRIFFIEPSVS
jgi:hypothetical protein